MGATKESQSTKKGGSRSARKIESLRIRDEARKLGIKEHLLTSLPIEKVQTLIDEAKEKAEKDKSQHARTSNVNKPSAGKSAPKAKANANAAEPTSPTARTTDEVPAIDAHKAAAAAVSKANKSGIQPQADVVDKDKTEKPNEPFRPPQWICEKLDIPFGTTIPWLRAEDRTPITSDSVYAVCANEYYRDFAALTEGERMYFRKASLRAGTINTFRFHGKHPVTILSAFEAENIRMAELSPTECVKLRGTFHAQPTTKSFTAVAPNTNTRFFRITGPVVDIQRIAENAVPEMHLRVTPHHVPGVQVAHMYLTSLAVEQLRKNTGALIEDLDHIETSVASAKQITIRANNRSVADGTVALFALRIQRADPSLGIEGLEPSFATLRTHNCCRLTLNMPITEHVMQQIRIKLPTGCLAFSDTPLNAWAGKPGDKQRAGLNIPRAPRVEVPEGTKLIRLAADHQPHPDMFAVVAAAIGGVIHSISDSRFTTRPMSCFVAIPKDKDTSDITAEPFVVDCDTGGSWRAWESGQAWV
jgi:hypothetical protein